MKTATRIESLVGEVKNLSEMELDELLAEIAEHTFKNNLIHVVEAHFDFSDGGDMELQDEINKLEQEIDELKDERLTIFHLTSDADDVELSDEDAVDSLKDIIDQISKIVI